MISNIHWSASAQTLDDQQKSMALIASLTAKNDWKSLKPELIRGLENGLTVNEIKEELVHLYAYVGFPKSIQGIQTLLDVIEERKASRIEDDWGMSLLPFKVLYQNMKGEKEFSRNLCKVHFQNQNLPISSFLQKLMYS